MIGVFDSGVGGLTVVKEIKKILPDVSIIYVGDTARLPYGNKSRETIRKYSSEIVDFLKDRDCKTIVVACNTASALAGDYLREKYPDLKIYDVVSSGAEAAVETTKKKKVGVIGTTATINSNIYNKKISDINSEIEVSVQACPLFAPLVEENWTNRPETKKIARVYLKDLKLKKIDTLLLGCTHYPLLEKTISGVMGKRTKVIASGEKMAEKLKNEKINFTRGEDQYFVSDLTEHFEKLAKKILGENIKIKKCTMF